MCGGAPSSPLFVSDEDEDAVKSFRYSGTVSIQVEIDGYLEDVTADGEDVTEAQLQSLINESLALADGYDLLRGQATITGLDNADALEVGYTNVEDIDVEVWGETY